MEAQEQPRAMKTYRVLAKPDIRLGAPFVPLTRELLAEALAGAVIRDLRPAAWGQTELELRLDRPDDGEALDQIERALRQVGLTLVETTVRRWVSLAATRALAGALGGFALAGGISESFAVGVAASVAGAFAASLVGEQAEKLWAEYDASRDRAGSWIFEKLQGPQFPAPQFPAPQSPGPVLGYSPT